MRSLSGGSLAALGYASRPKQFGHNGRGARILELESTSIATELRVAGCGLLALASWHSELRASGFGLRALDWPSRRMQEMQAVRVKDATVGQSDRHTDAQITQTHGHTDYTDHTDHTNSHTLDFGGEQLGSSDYAALLTS